MKRKAATVALLCFLVGFLSLYIYQSVRDLKHEMSIKMQPVKPNAQFQFGYPPTTTWPTVPPSIKAPKPQPRRNLASHHAMMNGVRHDR